MDMKIIDGDGEWIVNTGGFRIPDYDRAQDGSDMVYYEPGVPTKVVISDWIKGQVVLEKTDDPTTKPAVHKAKKA